MKMVILVGIKVMKYTQVCTQADNLSYSFSYLNQEKTLLILCSPNVLQQVLIKMAYFFFFFRVISLE